MKRNNKIKGIALALALLCTSYVSYAQLRVKAPYGKVLIGPNVTSSNEDAANVLSASIYGRNLFPIDNNGGGSKLAFGDFGQYSLYGWNVFSRN